jgi:hypothetical protein
MLSLILLAGFPLSDLDRIILNFVKLSFFSKIRPKTMKNSCNLSNNRSYLSHHSVGQGWDKHGTMMGQKTVHVGITSLESNL